MCYSFFVRDRGLFSYFWYDGELSWEKKILYFIIGLQKVDVSFFLWVCVEWQEIIHFNDFYCQHNYRKFHVTLIIGTYWLFSWYLPVRKQQASRASVFVCDTCIQTCWSFHQRDLNPRPLWTCLHFRHVFGGTYWFGALLNRGAGCGPNDDQTHVYKPADIC